MRLSSFTWMYTKPEMRLSSFTWMKTKPEMRLSSFTWIYTKPEMRLSSFTWMRTKPEMILSSFTWIYTKPEMRLSSFTWMHTKPKMRLSSFTWMHTKPEMRLSSFTWMKTKPEMRLSSFTWIYTKPEMRLSSFTWMKTKPETCFQSTSVQLHPAGSKSNKNEMAKFWRPNLKSNCWPLFWYTLSHRLLNKLHVSVDLPALALESTTMTDDVFAEINCGRAPSVEFATWSNNGSTLLDAVVTYVCNEGYRMTGNKSIKCLPNSKWTPSPICNSKFIFCVIIFYV